MLAIIAELKALGFEGPMTPELKAQIIPLARSNLYTPRQIARSIYVPAIKSN